MSCRLDSDMPPLGLLIDDTGPKKAAALAFYMFSSAVVCLQRFAGHEGHGSLFERKKKREGYGSMLNASLKMVRSNYEYSTVNLSAAAVFTYSSEVAVNT